MRELAMVAALLHDVGKVVTLRVSAGFSLESAVLDHNALTLELLAPHLKRLDAVNRELATALRYLWTWRYYRKGTIHPALTVAEAIAAADRISSGLSIERAVFDDRPEWQRVARWKHNSLMWRPNIAYHEKQSPQLTGTFGDTDSGITIQEIYARLTADRQRNHLILGDIKQSLAEGRSPILLTERKDHLEYLAGELRDTVRHLVVLHGGMGVKQRRKVMEHLASIPDDEERLILATGRYIGEGFDDARLDTLFLALPFSWKGMLVQYAGRLHRLHAGKVEVQVYDYVDSSVPMLAKMHDKRMKGFKTMGYEQTA